MQNQKQKNKNFKILNYILLLLFVGGIGVGLFFGFNHYKNKEEFLTVDDFSSTFTQQVKVLNNDSGDFLIDDAAKEIKQNLDWLNYDDSSVTVIDENNLLVTYQLKTFLEEENSLSYESYDKLKDEYVYLNFSLYFKSNIEFRSVQGDLLFDWVNGRINFVEPPPPPPPEGGTLSQRNQKDSRDDFFEGYDIQLLKDDGAKLEFFDGNYVVNLNPMDDLFSEFEKMLSFMSTNAEGESNPNGNVFVIWIGHDFLKNYLNLFDDSYSSDVPLFDYCFEGSQDLSDIKEICEPFLLVAEPAVELPIFDKKFNIGLGKTLVELENIVRKINSSTKDYVFELVSSNHILPDQEETVSNKTTLVIFLSLIAFIFFTFTIWFGLLGLINSTLISVLGLSFLALLSSFGLTLTPMLIGLSFLVLSFISLISIIYLKKFKEDISRNISKKKLLKNSFGTTLFKGFSPFLTIIIFLFLLGFFLTSTPQYTFVMLSIFVLIAYGVYILVFPLLMNWVVVPIDSDKFSYDKWNFVLGFKPSDDLGESGLGNSKKFKKDYLSEKNKKASIIVGCISVVVIIAGLGVFVGFKVTNDEGVRNIDNHTYQYELISQNKRDKNFKDFGDLDDPLKNKEMIAQLKSHEKFIDNILEENDVEVSSKEIVRNDVYELTYLVNPNREESKKLNQDDYEMIYEFSYGFILHSPTQIDESQYEDLSVLFEEEGYDFTGNLSLSNVSDFNSEEALLISDSFNTNNQSDFIFAILLSFIFISLLSLILFKWSGFAILSSLSIFEILFASFIIPLAFVPFSPTFWIFLPIGVIMSLVSKLLLFKDIDRTDESNLKNSISSSISKNLPLMLIFNAIILIAPLSLFISSGVQFLAPFVFILAISFITTISSITILPNFAFKVETSRFKLKKKQRESDILISKDKNQLGEEYIKGINY